MSKKKMLSALIVIMIMITISVSIVFGLKNPAAVYCEEMGYKFVVEETPEGQIGTCKFSGSENCPGWDFIEGKCGVEQSFCTKEGYELKVIDDAEKCAGIISSECAVCVLADGTETEVTELMNLSFEEGICSDGKCVIGENYRICPQDCPSGSYDSYCDGQTDSICDPDCTAEDDSDCETESKIDTNNIIIGISIIIIVFLIYFFIRKK